MVGGWIFCHKYNIGDGVELKRSDHSRLTSWSEGEILACICIPCIFGSKLSNYEVGGDTASGFSKNERPGIPCGQHGHQ